MRKIRSVVWSVLVSGLILCTSCGEDGAEQGNGFDEGILENWADNIIVPGYQQYVSDLQALNASVEAFTDEPTINQLNVMREAWLKANLSWQAVGLFEIGKAEELTLINYTNIYPTNTEDLIETLESGSYDLTSVNRQDEQGFPAIEYLIYGVQPSDQAIIELYENEVSGELYKTYLTDLSKRLETMAKLVLEDWENGYRDTFVANSGSDATSTGNKLVNDYIFYYEKHLRAGKIAIPAGFFSGSKDATKVEGVYSGTSKELFFASLDAMQNFFNGVPTVINNEAVTEQSLKSYIDFLDTSIDDESLSASINTQFEAARAQAALLSDNFGTQVENENSLMLQTYDELQKNVVKLKVDMLQLLSIKVDFVDADGD